MALINAERLRRILSRMLDENGARPRLGRSPQGSRQRRLLSHRLAPGGSTTLGVTTELAEESMLLLTAACINRSGSPCR